MEYRRELVTAMAAGNTTNTEVKSMDGCRFPSSIGQYPMAAGWRRRRHELAGLINEIGRQLAKTTEIVRAAVTEAQGTTTRSPRWRKPRRRLAT